MKRALCLLALSVAIWAAVPSSRAGVVFIPKHGCSGNIIDQMSTKPSAAYALRRVSCSYTGFAIRVHRASDASESDIGFLGESLDTPSIASFCSATTCNLAIYYDQSGNARDEICPGGAFSACPQIWASGAYSATIGSRPAILSNVTFNTGMTTNTAADGGIVGTNAGALMAVASAASGEAGNATASWWTVPILVSVNTPAATTNSESAYLGAFIQGGALYTPPSFNAGRYLGQWLGSPTDMFATKFYTYGTASTFALRWNTADPTPTKVYLNGGTPATNASTSANQASGILCYPNNGASGCQGFAHSFVGSTSEGYFFFTEPSLADTNLLGNDIATWYGLTWTNITL